LLADLKTIWDGTEGMHSDEILKRLNALVESPWGDLRGKPLDSRGLARFLKPYGVKPADVRAKEANRKGYRRADLHDAWQRYVPDEPRKPTPTTDPPADGSGEGEKDFLDEWTEEQQREANILVGISLLKDEATLEELAQTANLSATEAGVVLDRLLKAGKVFVGHGAPPVYRRHVGSTKKGPVTLVQQIETDLLLVLAHYREATAESLAEMIGVEKAEAAARMDSLAERGECQKCEGSPPVYKSLPNPFEGGKDDAA
jgi:hypothetical protein